ncbi:MAG: DUF1254 domain-containing protein [Anaerolineae bacterium]
MTDTQTTTQPNLFEDFQYATALQAAIYGIAPLGMWQRLSAEVVEPKTRKAALNAYAHVTSLATPTHALFRAPNNDTLYSTAWLDVRREPALLTVPDTHGRYYTVQLMDMFSDTLTNIGPRLFGTQAGVFAVVGPGWNGELPPSVSHVIRSETPFVLILLRILVDGPEDVPAVVALQQQFHIASLPRFEQGLDGDEPGVEGDAPPFEAPDAKAWFARLDDFLRMTPVRDGEAAVMAEFAAIGIGPGTATQQFPADDDTLTRAHVDGVKVAQAVGPTAGDLENGWRVMRRGIGTYGFDYIQRSAVWVGGPLANIIEESLYPSTILDSHGDMLTGKGKRYVVHFAPGQTPPVAFFWSLTIYKLSDGMLVENPINRYSIGDRTKGVRYGADGSLSIYVQQYAPSEDEMANWLPAPDEPFYLTLRLYGPKETAIKGEWQPPAVVPR